MTTASNVLCMAAGGLTFVRLSLYVKVCLIFFHSNFRPRIQLTPPRRASVATSVAAEEIEADDDDVEANTSPSFVADGDHDHPNGFAAKVCVCCSKFSNP